MLAVAAAQRFPQQKSGTLKEQAAQAASWQAQDSKDSRRGG
jgi:hypothetical protein